MLLGSRGDCPQKNQDDVAGGHFHLEFSGSETRDYFLPFLFCSFSSKPPYLEVTAPSTCAAKFSCVCV